MAAGTLVDRPLSSVPLRSLVRSVWYCAIDLPHANERVLPIGNVQLVFDLRPSTPRAVVVGPATQVQTISTGWMQKSAGAVLHIAAARNLVGCPVNELCDTVVDLSALWGRSASDLCDALASAPTPDVVMNRLEAALAARLVGFPDPSPAIRGAVSMLATGTPVGTVIDRTAASRSSLVRRFAEEVGLSPKRWAGLARFQRAVGILSAGHCDLADVAVRCGYADQAHMTREFRRFGQLTPATYLPRSHAEPNHLLS